MHKIARQDSEQYRRVAYATPADHMRPPDPKLAEVIEVLDQSIKDGTCDVAKSHLLDTSLSLLMDPRVVRFHVKSCDDDDVKMCSAIEARVAVALACHQEISGLPVGKEERLVVWRYGPVQTRQAGEQSKLGVTACLWS